jgi:putative selenium metabolism hydrolase
LKDNLIELIKMKVKEHTHEIVKLAKELISIPSPSFEEKRLSDYLFSELTKYGFDQVSQDELNNVLGIINGERDRPKILFTGHMDAVPPADMDDPYSGKIIEVKINHKKKKAIYGRGAVDMKGALTAMIFAAKILKELKIKPAGEISFAAVVCEEAGGSIGSKKLLKNLRNLDVAIIGEATDLNISIGHRGASFLQVTVEGKAAHASQPELGVNALYGACEIINEIKENVERIFPDHEALGRPTLTCTNLHVYPGTLNVIPNKCVIGLDYRSTPSFTDEKAISILTKLINRKVDPRLRVSVDYYVRLKDGEPIIDSIPPFYQDPKNNYVIAAKNVLEEALGCKRDFIIWKFATDGGFFHQAGITTFGIGPGKEELAHSSQEHLTLENLIQATVAYSYLMAKLPSALT